MYHYTECGLNNIYLVNGWHQIDTPYGKAVSVTNAEGLERAIARHLITRKPRLTGSEFRFLRKALGFSQLRLAVLIGNTEQAVALWEKKSNIPKWASNLLRKIVGEYLDENYKLMDILEQFSDLDKPDFKDEVKFEESYAQWKEAA
jgi:DNA-binding transcriptional regulator YiaG